MSKEVEEITKEQLCEIAMLKPLGGYVLMNVWEKSEETASGIILPNDNPDDKLEFGTVIDVGPGDLNQDGDLVPMDIERGKSYAYSKGNHIKFKKGNYEFLLIHRGSLLAMAI